MQRFLGLNNTLPCGLVVTALLFTLSAGARAGEENAAQQAARQTPPTRDLTDEANKALYCVGYAHLDTQWRWDFVTTIDKYIRATLDDNFHRLEQFPAYVFNFTGSVRYEMMKEYYPQRYERLRAYIASGRWYVSGSSVDEGDVNVPSAESIIRQVLYGNLYFKREFGKESVDFMLPDCFGFPASMPSLWAHCGLLGFSTQKLTWGSAVGIPFKVGVWEGPNGDSVIAALDPGAYVGAVRGRVDRSAHWRQRVENNGRQFGLWADYHYYGVGDQGGAPREEDVRNYVASQAAPDRQMDIALTSSDQLYRDITPELRARLPRYEGDMLLTEHSAGTLTSQSYMKRWNRQAEQLADAAERMAATSWWLGHMNYPREKLERAWVRLLANQMHDILPGTSLPRAYRYSWNDDIIAMNQFAQVLTNAVGTMAAELDTKVTGTPIVVFNPLATGRSDTVEATVPAGDAMYVRVIDPDGKEVPSQILSRSSGTLRILFLADMPAHGLCVFDVQPADRPSSGKGGPQAAPGFLQNDNYRVTFNEDGDIEQIVDLRTNKELLQAPASLVFTHERPRLYPAWNMDWADRKQAPIGKVDGPPQWRIVEKGPVRAAIEVTRRARNSIVTQTVRLARGDAGRIVEVAARIDWQSAACALKASFPLTVTNTEATYNWGCGTVQRGNNDPTKYEVPSHEWFDLTDESGAYGVTILEDSKFGSDKPSDHELRLTLLFTPGVRGSFQDQHSQDWGIHDMRYALYGHEQGWRSAGSDQRGRRFNQPLRAFCVDKHEGTLGRRFALAQLDSPQVDIRAFKVAEQRNALIIRVQELWGKPAKDVRLRFTTAIEQVDEVDGQERTLATLPSDPRTLRFDLPPYGIRSFALTPRDSTTRPTNRSTPIPFRPDTDVFSLDTDPSDGAMDMQGRSYPGEGLAQMLTDNDVSFRLGRAKSGNKQALTCRGQTIPFGKAKGDTVHLLAAATEDAVATFHIGTTPHTLGIGGWTGFVGQWYDRVFDKTFEEADARCAGKVVAILPAYIKRDPIAWFRTHRHDPDEGNQPYRFSYMFHYTLPREDGQTTITLPYDERIRLFALSVADTPAVTPAAPLYDAFENTRPIAVRHTYTTVAVADGHEPVGTVHNERAGRFDQLTIGEPRHDDDVDDSGEGAYSFVVYAPDNRLAPHQDAGVVDGCLVRLNDGKVAENNDDTARCAWFDNEGRFTLDLHTQRKIKDINTYSWHRSNRAVQYFSLWGASGDTMPDPGFGRGDNTDWTLIATVDTREAGQGGIHATRITNEAGTLGPYRHLLWICEDMGEGTFLTEIDIDFAETAP